jgi:hypothetical protein
MISLCHSVDCQRRTGSTYGVAAFFARDNVEARGNFRSYSRNSDSGFAVNFNFCADRGSTVFWEPARKPDTIAVAVGGHKGQSEAGSAQGGAGARCDGRTAAARG